MLAFSTGETGSAYSQVSMRKDGPLSSVPPQPLHGGEGMYTLPTVATLEIADQDKEKEEGRGQSSPCGPHRSRLELSPSQASSTCCQYITESKRESASCHPWGLAKLRASPHIVLYNGPRKHDKHPHFR